MDIGLNRALGRVAGLRVLAGGAHKEHYLLDDEFTDTLAAGAISGTKATDGINVRSGVDTTNLRTIANGVLAIESDTGSLPWGNPSHRYPVFTRKPGRLLIQEVTPLDNARYFAVGFDKSGTSGAEMNGNGWYFSASSLYTIDAGATSTRTAVNYPLYSNLLAVQLRAAGAFYFRKLYATDAHIFLESVSGVNAEANLHPSYTSDSGVFTSDFIRMLDVFLPAPLLSDGFGGTFGASDGLGHAEGIANSTGAGGAGRTWEASVGVWANVAGTLTPQSLTGGVAIATCSVSSKNVLYGVSVTRTAGVAGVIVRYRDASNFVYAVHDGTNVTLRKVLAGVDSQVLAPTASTYGAGKRLEILCSGTRFAVRYGGSLVGAEQTINDASLQTGTGVGIYTTDTGNTFDNATAYAHGDAGEYDWMLGYCQPSPDSLPGANHNVFLIGDSKTANFGPLVTSMNTATDHFTEAPARIGYGGYSVAQIKAIIDAELASRNSTPDYVCINLGVNESGTPPAEATWEANYGYILDAVHTKWPLAQVYLMRVWGRGTATGCSTLDGYIPTIIATRPWAHLGPDERVFLENGDNGVTYTSDGVHPTQPAGYRLTAAQWRIALGFS